MFLYLHIPYCEMRCGFCNLFTTVERKQDRIAGYLDALQRQSEEVAKALGETTFARMAIGGGTPTLLATTELERLLDFVKEQFVTDCGALPTSIETSPGTATSDKLALLRERGIRRISIGVQSFHEEDAARIGRPMRREQMIPALQRIRDLNFPAFNIDLIYGGEGQTKQRWLDSVKEAVGFEPEEIFLYPLYVRPLTTLGKLDCHWDDQRLEAYRVGRELLLDVGYQQISMRMFRRPGTDALDAPTYCCQQDGMVGLGCGARSYTESVHYATKYAVGRAGVREILDDYMERSRESFAFADHGTVLNSQEQIRRDAIMSLLQCEGLDRQRFAQRFGIDALDALPQLLELETIGLMRINDQCLQLTPEGIERSDAVGPWLYSPVIRNLIKVYAWR